MTEQEIEAIAQRIFEESSEGTYKDWSREVRDRCLAQIEAIKQKVLQLVDEIDFNTARDLTCARQEETERQRWMVLTERGEAGRTNHKIEQLHRSR